MRIQRLLFEFRTVQVEVLRTLKKDDPKQPKHSRLCVHCQSSDLLCTNGCVSKYWAPFSLNQLNSDSQFPPEDFLLQSF